VVSFGPQQVFRTILDAVHRIPSKACFSLSMPTAPFLEFLCGGVSSFTRQGAATQGAVGPAPTFFVRFRCPSLHAWMIDAAGVVFCIVSCFVSLSPLNLQCFPRMNGLLRVLVFYDPASDAGVVFDDISATPA